MSIIEKAAARLHKNTASATPLQAIALPEPNQPPVERTEVRVESGPRKVGGKKVEINLARLNELGFITAGGGRSSIAENFRIIKRPLLKKAFASKEGAANPGNLIMVTSSMTGEGKTFCAINLAMSIAMERDHTVLLVDADVSRPSVLSTLGIEAEGGGLMDILLGDNLGLADVMLRTNVDTLRILPSGRSHHHSTELLASQTMSILLEEISNRYPDRVIIFDSPPLLFTSEAHVLATKMGQIVVVVEAEKTTQHVVKTSLQQLEGCANVNLVYNKSQVSPGRENYDWKYHS